MFVMFNCVLYDIRARAGYLVLLELFMHGSRQRDFPRLLKIVFLKYVERRKLKLQVYKENTFSLLEG